MSTVSAIAPSTSSHAPRAQPGGRQDFAALLHQRGVPEAPRARAWESVPNSAFRQRIAQAERSAEQAQGGYGVRNPNSGALGRYQFTPITLQDLGWRTAHGAWTQLAERHGVRSEQDFLGNHAAQESAMTMFLRRVEVQLDRNGAAAQQGATLRGIGGQEITLTESGLMGAAHRRGAGMVARWINHRTHTPDAPLSAAQRAAFAQVERRLQDFSAVAYAPTRAVPPARVIAANTGTPAS